MAGIEKIYAEIEEAKKFINWVESGGDERFTTEFEGASLKDFMYVKSLEDLSLVDRKVFPISNFPEIVDRWLFRQEDLPRFAYDSICMQYNLTTEEDKNNFGRVIEEIDDRPSGKHLKIVSRSGILSHSNYFENCCLEVGYDHDHKCVGDFWWYLEEVDEWESSSYPKKRNIGNSRSSCQLMGRTSLKAVLRNILDKYKFPIGTIVVLSEFRYIGDIYLRITK